ncbi:MAG: hypothetical protein KBT72_02420 [Zhongshania sp.]|nr:hypothetical protein [Zhongshania sp.]
MIVTVVSDDSPFAVLIVNATRLERCAIVTLDGTVATLGCELLTDSSIGLVVGSGRLRVAFMPLPASTRPSGALKLNVTALAMPEKLIASTANSTDNTLLILRCIRITELL